MVVSAKIWLPLGLKTGRRSDGTRTRTFGRWDRAAPATRALGDSRLIVPLDRTSSQQRSDFLATHRFVDKQRLGDLVQHVKILRQHRAGPGFGR